MNKPRILFWHRKDLRIFDNQALIKAFSLSNAITATYILDKNYSHDFNANSRAWFLGNSLQELGNNWKKMGSRLVMEEGDPVLIIPQLAKTIDAKFVFWNKSIEPYEINRDLQGALEGWMPNGQHDPSAVELAQEALAGSINNALSFTYQLIEIIQDRVKYTKRHTGPAWPASRTLRERIGSCRDLAMLMVEACRSIGIPSRFVSGYHFEDPLPSELDLHAWAELYIPGAGWRGFDPSGKGLIDDRYLTLVSSSKSNLTSVITGNFIGKNNLENTLSWEIKPLEIK